MNGGRERIDAVAPVKRMRAAAARQHPSRRLAADQEAAEAGDPPHLLEERRVHLDEVADLVVAGVAHRHLDRARRLSALEQSHDVALLRRVRRHRGGASAGRPDRGDDLRQSLRRTAGDEDVQPFAPEPLAQRRAEPDFRADADDDGRAVPSLLEFRHRVTSQGYFLPNSFHHGGRQMATPLRVSVPPW